jgi:hypothetical protein
MPTELRLDRGKQYSELRVEVRVKRLTLHFSGTMIQLPRRRTWTLLPEGPDLEEVTAAAYTPVKGDEDCYMQGLSDTPTAPVSTPTKF